MGRTSSPAPHARPPTARRALGAGLLALLVLGAALPLVAAEPDAASDRRAAHARDHAPAHREGPRDRVADAPGAAIAIAFNGTGTTRDNETYRVAMDGIGKVRYRTTDGNLTVFAGIARMSGQIVDADGHVVKDASGLVKIRARADANGTWHWGLVSHARVPFWGMPTLLLRGTGTGPTDGAIELEGHGYSLLKSDATDRRLRLALEVTGTVERAAA